MNFVVGQIIYNNTTDTSLPVLVFVHGWTGKMAHIWATNNNPLWDQLEEAKFRAAFVNLDPNGSIQTNAQSLTDQLKQITTKYGVKKVIAVCHSKGGLDIQGSIYYNNADTLIDSVFTICTPHWGSPLADLLYYIDSLKILGISDMVKKMVVPATYDLQMSQMADFRKMFDTNERCAAVKFYTFAGTGSETDNIIQFEKNMMNYFGQNDDFVNVKFAYKPGATHVATLPYYHDEMIRGENIWNTLLLCILGKCPSNQIVPTTYTVTINIFQIGSAIMYAAINTYGLLYWKYISATLVLLLTILLHYEKYSMALVVMLLLFLLLSIVYIFVYNGIIND